MAALTIVGTLPSTNPKAEQHVSMTLAMGWWAGRGGRRVLWGLK